MTKHRVPRVLISVLMAVVIVAAGVVVPPLEAHASVTLAGLGLAAAGGLILGSVLGAHGIQLDGANLQNGIYHLYKFFRDDARLWLTNAIASLVIGGNIYNRVHLPLGILESVRDSIEDAYPVEQPGVSYTVEYAPTEEMGSEWLESSQSITYFWDAADMVAGTGSVALDSGYTLSAAWTPDASGTGVAYNSRIYLTVSAPSGVMLRVSAVVPSLSHRRYPVVGFGFGYSVVAPTDVQPGYSYTVLGLITEDSNGYLWNAFTGAGYSWRVERMTADGWQTVSQPTIPAAYPDIPVDRAFGRYVHDALVQSIPLPYALPLDNAAYYPTTTTFPLDDTLGVDLSVPSDYTGTIRKPKDIVVAPGDTLPIPDTTVPPPPGIPPEPPTMRPKFLTKFPFSLPWDFVAGVQLLAEPPSVPRWEIDLYAGLADRVPMRGSTTLVIDLSQFEFLGKLSRWLSTLGYDFTLIFVTRKLTGTGG